MKKIISILILAVIMTMSVAYAAVYEQDNPPSDQTAPGEAQFAVTVLKYEPYPVTPGSYFDLWIKVDNIGNTDATNAKFELVPKYPFSSTDNLVREYGKVVGNRGKADENNQVVLKYRVKVADDSPEGISNIEFDASTGNIGAGPIKKNLPIDIEKTKTDFDVVMQDSSAQGTSIAISNIGEDAATAVTVTVPEQDGFTVKGPRSSIIGNLNMGDFTTLTFQITQVNKNAKELLVNIDYTDVAGVRSSIQKKVSVDITTPTSAVGTTTKKASSTTSILLVVVYIAIGLGVGILIMALRNRARKRRRI